MPAPSPQVGDFVLHTHCEALSAAQQLAGVHELCHFFDLGRSDPFQAEIRFCTLSSLNKVREGWRGGMMRSTQAAVVGENKQRQLGLVRASIMQGQGLAACHALPSAFRAAAASAGNDARRAIQPKHVPRL